MESNFKVCCVYLGVFLLVLGAYIVGFSRGYDAYPVAHPRFETPRIQPFLAEPDRAPVDKTC